MGTEENWDGFFGRSSAHPVLSHALLLRASSICAVLDDQFVHLRDDVPELLPRNVDEQVADDFCSDLESAFEALLNNAQALQHTINRALAWHRARLAEQPAA